MRAIDADYLIKRLDKCDPMNGIGLEPVMAIRDVKLLISVMPKVDAVPVVHGQWEGDETCEAYDIAGIKTWAVKRKCSICGFTHKFIEAHMYYEFCPNCGAKMDLEEQHD